MILVVCVLLVHRSAVWVYTGVGHAHTVVLSGPWYTARCQWCRDILGHNGAARLCVAIAAVGPTMVTPEDRGGLLNEGAIRWYFLVYLCRCGDRLLRPEGWYNMATHPVDS